METDILTSAREVMPPGTPTCLSPDVRQSEPPMHLHRPSSDRAQDVSHILASLFEDLYTRDVLSKDAVENLTRSSEGSTSFHKKCMKELSKARARGASADEKALRLKTGVVNEAEREKMGLPQVDSHFRWCLDEEMMKKHKLIVPSDLFAKVRTAIDGPSSKTHVPHFSLPTISSSKHFLKEDSDDGYIHDKMLSDTLMSSRDDEKSLTTLSSDSAEKVSVPPRYKVKKAVSNLSEKDRWRENMKPEDRSKDREILARLEQRHNFLKNPRFIPITDPGASRLLTKFCTKEMLVKAGRVVVQDLPAEGDFQVFEAFPHVVRFTDWTVGRVYETILDLKNISTVSRQMRILPPKTSYFSLGLGKYPGSDSLVAPGISCKFNIRFMPDSLADYEDQVEVLTQVGQPLIVKVIAKREPPVLTIAEKIQCGSCLVGGVKLIELPIKNLGGNGRFCVLKRSMWPAANFKTVVNPGCLDLGAFQIRPSVFEILAGKSVFLELFFSPEETKKYREDLVIVCDNCQTVHFTLLGEGERAGVELVSVSDGGEESHKVGELADLTANHFIHFPSLNPHSFYMRQIILHNSTKVEMPYSWHILMPNLTSARDQLLPSSEINWETLEFYPDENPCFFVEPMQGTLQPDGIHEFVVTFAPHQVGTYNSVLHLILSDVPDSQLDSKHRVDIQGRLPPSVSVDVMEKISHGNRDESANKSRPGSLSQTSSKPPSLRKVISLEVELAGESIPYSVVVHPLAVVVTGNILIGTTVRRPLQMANYSLAPVQFQWESETTPNIVEIKPPMGIIGPGEIADLEVTVTGLQHGPLTCDLLCKVEHQEKPLRLSVVANIEGPTVAIDNMMIDFGLLKLGESPSQELYIRNTTQLNAIWALRVEDQEKIGLSLYPQSGELTSLGQQAITVTYKPTSCQTLNTCIFLDIVGGHGSSVGVHAEVQVSQVCFRECTMVLKDVYLSVPKPTSAFLINQTSFPTYFQFDRLRGNPNCEVTVNPSNGVLAPREERELEVVFTSHIPGEVTDVYLPCRVEGMRDMIVLGFYANAQVLSVDVTTPDHGGTDLKVIYSDPVAVGKTATSRVVVTNLTAIRAPWSASVDHFKAAKPQPKPPSYDFKSVKTRRAMLGRTPNLADPLSKTPHQSEADHKAMMLSDGRGAAFFLNPSCGYLEPYQCLEISIIAYNNMWGKYRDNLTINIEGFAPRTIPVELNVRGCPLAFQVAHDQEETAVVRYGSHLEGGPNVLRKLRVNNSSCDDIRLDWKTFNYPTGEDRKVVDLNMWFGEAFPIKRSTTLSSTRNLHSSSMTSLPNLKVKADPGSESDATYPHFVNVKIDPHLGVRSDTPFHVEPDQVIVPAHGHVVVSSIFQPLLNQCSDDEGRAYSSYVLGFMTLDDATSKEQSDKLSRDDGYFVDPLRLELTSYVRAGRLHVETQDDEEETNFHLPLSDLINDEQRTSSVKQVHTVTLVNPTEAVLNFHLFVKKPFYLAFDNSNRKHHTLPLTELKPQHNIKVQVMLCMSDDVINDLTKLRSGRTLEGATLLKDKVFDIERIEYRTNLQINYCNGITQIHPLVGTISCPSFKISTNNIDYGICFVGQEVHHLVTIVNQSGADTRWRARVEGISDSKAGQFRIEPSEGFLEAFTNHRAETKATISIFYVAKSNDSCFATIVFDGSLNEPRRLLKVIGTGSFDGMVELK